MKTARISVVLAFVLLLLPTMVVATDLSPTPTTSGPTGLIRMPTADVVPARNFSIAADYGINYRTNDSQILYKVNLGTFKGVEIGVVGGSDPNTSQFREGVFINMKYSLSTEDVPNPLRLALGLENLASNSQTDVYMVATKYMSTGWVISFGFMGDFPRTGFRPLAVGGLAIPIGGSMIVGVGDILVGESLFQVNAGVRMSLTNGFDLLVNWVNIGEDPRQRSPKDPRSFTFGISWLNPFI